MMVKQIIVLHRQLLMKLGDLVMDLVERCLLRPRHSHSLVPQSEGPIRITPKRSSTMPTEIYNICGPATDRRMRAT